jgi:hypothetical protein
MKKILLVSIMLSVCLAISAHPGRTDKNGGHNGPDGYHYHNDVTVVEDKFYILADLSDNVCHREACELLDGEKTAAITKAVVVTAKYQVCPVCEPNI